MKLARELEQRLERLVDGATAAVFRGRMHPVDMAGRLVRQVDFMQTQGAAGPEIPNHLEVSVNPMDLDDTIDIAALETELANAVTSTAADRGWRISGPIVVALAANTEVPRGLVDCTGDSVSGPLDPWGQLIGMDTADVFDLGDNRILIGRALDSDVVLPVPEVSRYHAIVYRSDGTVALVDLGSANGTFRNAARLGKDPEVLVPGDVATFGNVPFAFRTR
jgi:hypothetical protein